MSDARNSSGNIRGGGAKQTGGSGRTNKGASGSKGNSKASLLGESQGDDRSDAKRKLQLLVSSKGLAANVRKALLSSHTQQEYDAHDIPLPSTDDAKKKLLKMKEFTAKWYDKTFREQWLDTVTQVWLEELNAQYEAAVAAAANARSGGGGGANQEDKSGEAGEAAMSIEELQETIANLDPNDTEERQRLKKKLNNKRKKQRKKGNK